MFAVHTDFLFKGSQKDEHREWKLHRIRILTNSYRAINVAIVLVIKFDLVTTESDLVIAEFGYYRIRSSADRRLGEFKNYQIII